MILYFFQTIIISALLTLSYFIFFQSAKQFRLRRFLILLIPILSLLIPFANKLSFLNPEISNNLFLAPLLNAVDITSLSTATDNFQFNFINTAIAIYTFVSLLLLVKLALQIKRIFQLRRQSKSIDGVYFTQNTHQPFSFFNSIFIPESQEKDLDLILNHERVHISQKHSIDIIFYELLKVVFWFNPLCYFLKKELSNVHEFLADQKLLSEGTDIEKYCEILLQNNNLKYMAIGNNFNNSLTKIRFIMMTKNNNKRWLPFKVFGMLVVMFTITLAFHNCNQEPLEAIVSIEEIPDASEMQENIDAPSDDSEVFQFLDVDVKPEFPGGTSKLMQFLSSNTKYPEVARENGTQGKVFVNFTVGKDGKISEVGINRGVSPELDAEAIRVVSSMPNWTPGEMSSGEKVKVSYIVPLNFKLN